MIGELRSAAGPAPAPTAPAGLASSLRFVDDMVGLTAIFEPAVNVVTLRRAPPRALVEDGARAAREVGFCARVDAPAAHPEVVARRLDAFPHLAGDVQFWVEALVDLTGCDRVGVRLARLDAAMCPRFHVDHVPLRVVCTYAGPGTEFVAHEHVDRSRLGHAARGAPDEVSGLLRAPGCVRAAGALDVVLLKGEAWPDNAGRGAVHRSPAVGVDAPRLLLTLDPL